ncbi:hypothetical protein LTR17_008468 [Elasticomyces elasticus]|nr:hypothetical protein LTR17_008468 [Elasticomyces elasticus]
MVATDTIEIAPDGDVTLLCGEHVGDTKILGLRVSSHILSFGSPVFRALLSGRFKEAITLATTSTVVIPLPEDDPHHMTVLCNILHMRHDQEPYSIRSPATLADFATLCDKYDCLLAVKPTLERYVMADLHTATAQVAGKYFPVAVALCYTDLVGEIGDRLVLQLDQPARNVVAFGSSHLSILCDAIDDIVRRAQREIASFIDYEIQTQLPGRYPFETCPSTCTVRSRRVTSLLQQLSTHALWPAGSDGKNLESTLRIMEGICLFDPVGIETCSAGPQCAKHADDDCNLTARSAGFHMEAEKIRRGMVALDIRWIDASQ